MLAGVVVMQHQPRGFFPTPRARGHVPPRSRAYARPNEAPRGRPQSPRAPETSFFHGRPFHPIPGSSGDVIEREKCLGERIGGVELDRRPEMQNDHVIVRPRPLIVFRERAEKEVVGIEGW